MYFKNIKNIFIRLCQIINSFEYFYKLNNKKMLIIKISKSLRFEDVSELVLGDIH